MEGRLIPKYSCTVYIETDNIKKQKSRIDELYQKLINLMDEFKDLEMDLESGWEEEE